MVRYALGCLILLVLCGCEPGPFLQARERCDSAIDGVVTACLRAEGYEPVGKDWQRRQESEWGGERQWILMPPA